MRRVIDQGQAALVGVLLGFFVLCQAILISDYFELGPPAFEGSVSVPDHLLGQDPYVIYDRIVRDDLRGEWTVEVQWKEPGNGWVEMCQGGSTATYSLDERRTIEMPLSTYAGIVVASCIDRPGTYRLTTAWKMNEATGSKLKGFWHVSNEFQVTD